jgi:hypothetical protein
MKARLEALLNDVEKTRAPEIWSYYSKNVAQLGKKTAEEIEESIKTLTTKACWFLAIASIKHTQCIKLGYASKKELYDSFLELMKERGWKPHTVLTLVKVLAPFRKAELEAALQSLFDGRVGNHNAQTELSLEQRSIIIELYQASGKIKTTYKQYCDRAKKMFEAGIWKTSESVSLSTIKTVVKAYSNTTQARGIG